MTGTTARRQEIRVASAVEVRGEPPVVNVEGRDRSWMFVPTMTFPLDHVSGAEADLGIERKLWRAWVFGRHGEYCTPKPGTRPASSW